MKKRIAILGLGKVGQMLLQNVVQNSELHELFEVKAIWNRTEEIFSALNIPDSCVVVHDLNDLDLLLSDIDLVVECAHPSVLWDFGLKIIEQADLFVSSSTAFANLEFRSNIFRRLNLGHHKCFVPIGASIGIWDVIKLDQLSLLKGLEIIMRKDPTAFKIDDEHVRYKISQAIETNSVVQIAEGSVSQINYLAPQNSNTMSVYALAASSIGFEHCKGQLIADTSLNSHIVSCAIEATSGLEYTLTRDNPAKKGAVTGSATFGSFLNSLKHFENGIAHNNLIFC